MTKQVNLAQVVEDLKVLLEQERVNLKAFPLILNTLKGRCKQSRK